MDTITRPFVEVSVAKRTISHLYPETKSLSILYAWKPVPEFIILVDRSAYRKARRAPKMAKAPTAASAPVKDLKAPPVTGRVVEVVLLAAAGVEEAVVAG
jgi:hypothetical protein